MGRNREPRRGFVLLLSLLALGGCEPVAEASEPRDRSSRDVFANRPLADEEYLWWPLPESEQRYGVIDGYHIKDYVHELTAIARKSRDDGDPLWGLIAGQPRHHEAKRWIEAQFRRIGLQDVRIQEYDLAPQWVPRSWSVSISAGGRTVPLESAHVPHGAPPTRPGGLDLEAVWVGLGSEADFVGRDVRGKAAFVINQPAPSATRHLGLPGARRAQELGAAAIVWVSDYRGNLEVQPRGGAENFSVPAFIIGREDGFAVQELIGRNPNPRVHLELNVDMVPGLTVGDVFGVLPGTTEENIVIMAHYDTFFEGALDNASGVGGMLALAEFYAQQPQSERRRTITFVGFGGHHSGRETVDGGPVSVDWMAANMVPFLERTALIVNMEHLGVTQTYPGDKLRNYEQPDGLIYSNQVSARRWWVGGSDALRAMVMDTFDRYGVEVYAAMTSTPSGDLGSVHRLAPAVHVIEHVFYHTTMDTAELVPAAALERVTQAYARIIDEVNRMELAEIRAGLVP